MAKKIDTVYTDNPSAGNDPSINYKFASTDGSTDAIALDMDQVAAAVAVRIGTSPPPVDTENLAQLVITIQNNTLVPNVQPITGIDYTHYIVVTDSDVVPTYPTGFSQGPLPSLLPALASWDAETKYIYLYDLPTTTLKTLTNSNGESGITVTPKDTLPPVLSSQTLTLGAGTDPTTEVDYSFAAATDSGTGVNTSFYYIIDDNTGLLFRVVTATSGTLSNLTPNTQYSLIARTLDQATPANYVDTSVGTITTAAVAGGEVNFTETGNPAYTVEEGSGNLNINLTRTVTGTLQTVTLSTRAWTAEGQFTALAGGAKTVTFPADATASVNAVVNVGTDINADTDNMFEVYIDTGSETGGITIGANNAILVSVTGTGGSSLPVQDGSANHLVSIWGDSALSPDPVTVQPDPIYGDTWAEKAAPGGFTGTPSGTANVYYQLPAVATTRHSFTTSILTAPQIQFNAEFNQTGTHYLWVHSAIQDATRDSILGSIDEVESTTKWVINSAIDTWQWDRFQDALNVTSTGPHTIKIGHRIIGGTSDGPLISGVIVTDNASYTPSGVVAETAVGSGTTVPNPDNPTVPTGDVPASAITPTSIYPTEAHEHQTRTQPIIATFAGSELNNVAFSVTYNSGANTVQGTSVSDGTNVATFYPTTAYPAATTISWTLTGTITDATGSPGSISTSAATFVTLDKNDAAILLAVDFDGHSPHAYTLADAATWNASNQRDFGTGTFTQVPQHISEVNLLTANSVNVEALSGYNTARDIVLQVRYPANNIQKGGVWGAFHADAGSTVYIAYDIYHSSAFDWQLGGKLMCGAAGGYSKSGSLDPNNATPGFSARAQWYTELAYSNLSGPTGTNILSELVTYASRGSDFPYAWSLTTTHPGQTSDAYVFTPGWHRIENKLTMNTDGAADGTLDVYVDGVHVMALTGRQWRENAATGVKFDVLMFSTFFGGNDSRWAPETDQYRLADNFVVSTSPITH